MVDFNWRNGQWNRLYDWSLILVIWTWACHLEVEWAAFHCHLHGNERGLKVPHLQEENYIINHQSTFPQSTVISQ